MSGGSSSSDPLMPTSDQTILDPVTIPQIVTTRVLPLENDYFETGGLQSGSSKSLVRNFPQVVANNVALIALSVAGVKSGTTVLVQASTTFGDNGGGFFKYDSASVATVNGGTVLAPTVGSGRWLRVFIPLVDIAWFGAVGDGTTSCQAAYNAAYAYLVANGGGTMFFSKGSYVLNAYIQDNNITLVGTMGTAELKQVCFIPLDAALPTLLIGNDTKYVRDACIQGISVYGITNAAAQAVAALRLAGGSYQPKFIACNFDGGQKTVWYEGGATYPCETAVFLGCDLRADYNNAAARGLYVKRHAGSDSTALRWIGGHFNGQNAGYLIELDGEYIYFLGVYCDMFGGHGLLVSAGGGSLTGHGVVFDCPSGAVVTTVDSVADPTRYINGNIRVDVGNLVVAGPVTVVLDGSHNFIPQQWTTKLKVGATGTPLTRLLSATGSIDFGAISAGNSATGTIAVAGAGVGDSVTVNVADAGGPYTGLTHDAWVSATGVVTIRAINFTAAPIDPSAQNFRVTVFSVS